MTGADPQSGWGSWGRFLLKPIVGAIALTLIFLLVRWFGLLSSPVVSTRLAGVPSKPPEGLLYYLPLTVVDIDVVAKLSGCRLERVPDDNEPNPASTIPKFVVDFALRPTITVRNVADPAAAYLLEGKSLRAALFSSDVTVELSGGIVTSVSAQSVSLGVQLPAPSGTTSTPVQGIQAASVDTRLASNVREIDERRACGPLIVSQLSRRAKLIEQISANPAPALLEILRAELATLDKTLSPEARVTLIPRQADPKSMKVKIDPAQMFAGIGGELQNFLQTNALEVVVVPLSPSGNKLPAGDLHGLVYRVPAAAMLSLCQTDCALDGSGSLAATARLYSPPRAIQVAQFGAEAVMPVERTLFSNNSIALAFTPEGSLTRMSTSDKPVPPAGIITAPNK